MKQRTHKHLAPPYKNETPGRPGAGDSCPYLGHETRAFTKDRHIVSQLYIKVLQTHWCGDRLDRQDETRILALRPFCTKPIG